MGFLSFKKEKDYYNPQKNEYMAINDIEKENVSMYNYDKSSGMFKKEVKNNKKIFNTTKDKSYFGLTNENKKFMKSNPNKIYSETYLTEKSLGIGNNQKNVKELFNARNERINK